MSNATSAQHVQEIATAPWAVWVLHDAANPTSRTRGLVQQSLHRLGADPQAIERAVLAASELASNACQHACPPVLLSIWLDAQRVTIHVADGDRSDIRLPAYDPSPRQISIVEFDGLAAISADMEESEIAAALAGIERRRGLQVVVHETQGHCGVIPNDHGKAVWFSLTAPWAQPAPPTRHALPSPARAGQGRSRPEAPPLLAISTAMAAAW